MRPSAALGSPSVIYNEAVAKPTCLLRGFATFLTNLSWIVRKKET